VNKIKVSICVPARNRANFLVRTLRSLTDQSFNKDNYPPPYSTCIFYKDLNNEIAEI